MSLIDSLSRYGGPFGVVVGDEFSGDVGIYAAAWALSRVLKDRGLGGGVVWKGWLPPAAEVFPVMHVDGDYIPIYIKPGVVEFEGQSFDWQFSPVELFMDEADGDEMTLAAIFVSLYAATDGFSAEGMDVDILRWFKSVLERGFDHYRWVDLIYTLSSPNTLNVWGNVMSGARFLEDGRVVGVWEDGDVLPPAEWKRLAAMLSRAGTLGEVYVKDGDVWRVYSSDGAVRLEEKLPW